jgi:hypothetical protein
MNKTNRIQRADRPNSPREPIILRSPVQGPLFLKPSFAISAQRDGLTVNVSVRPAKEPLRRA